MPQTDTANVIPELAGGWNDGLAYDFFRFLKRPLIGQGRIGRNDVPALDRAPRHYDTMRP